MEPTKILARQNLRGDDSLTPDFGRRHIRRAPKRAFRIWAPSGRPEQLDWHGAVRRGIYQSRHPMRDRTLRFHRLPSLISKIRVGSVFSRCPISNNDTGLKPQASAPMSRDPDVALNLASVPNLP